MIERRKNRMTNGLQSVKDRVMGTASDARHAVADRAQSAGDSAGIGARHRAQTRPTRP